MTPSKRILAVVPARGGSKGLPGKNLAMLGSYSLVQHAALAATASSLITDVCVSTDSPKIRDHVEQIGVEVPWLRATHLATDEASTVDVVLDAFEREAGKSGNFDVVALIEPTAPLRKPGDIDSVLRSLLDNWSSRDACITVAAANFHPSAILSIDQDTELIGLYPGAFSTMENRRQDGPQAFLPIGNCFAIKADVLRETRTFYPEQLAPYILEPWQSIEIDEENDLFLARATWETKGFEEIPNL